MIKFDSTSASASPGISHIVLLIFSTWLVAGAWLIFTGAELIYKMSNGDSSFAGYFFGTVRILIGVHTFRFARPVAIKSSDSQKTFILFMTSTLFTIMIVLPVLSFIFVSSVALLGTYEPDEHYRENALRLLAIAICYMLAIIFADWRLRKDHLDVRRNLDS